jgi:hypothetical protein
VPHAPSIPPSDIENEIVTRVTARGGGKTVCPSEIARVLGGDHPDEWSPLMQPVRRAAVRLMKAGRIVILRKGRPVDPDDFRGVYRLGLPSGGVGLGNSASV